MQLCILQMYALRIKNFVSRVPSSPPPPPQKKNFQEMLNSLEKFPLIFFFRTIPPGPSKQSQASLIILKARKHKIFIKMEKANYVLKHSTAFISANLESFLKMNFTMIASARRHRTYAVGMQFLKHLESSVRINIGLKLRFEMGKNIFFFLFLLRASVLLIKKKNFFLQIICTKK